MPEPRSWLLWSSKPGVACFDGPAIRADESVRVLDAAQVAARIANAEANQDLLSALLEVTRAERDEARQLAEDEFEIRCAEERTTAALAVELERLRRIEAAAREALRVLDCDFYLAHEEVRDELREALEE